MRRKMGPRPSRSWYSLRQVSISPFLRIHSNADVYSPRCRKKIKRVERRGTLDPASLGPHPVSPPPPAHDSQSERITAAKTLPAHLAPAHAPKMEPEHTPPPPSRSSPSHPPARARSYSDAEDELDVDAEADEDDDLANDLLAAIES